MESWLCRVPDGVHSRWVVSFRQACGLQPDSARAMATATTRWPLGPLLAKPALLAQDAQRRAARLASAGLIRTVGPAAITPGRASGGVSAGRPAAVLATAALAPEGPAENVVVRSRARLATAAARTRLLRITGTNPPWRHRGSRVAQACFLIACAPVPRRACPAPPRPPGRGTTATAGRELHPPRAMASRAQRAGMRLWADIPAWPAAGGEPRNVRARGR